MRIMYNIILLYNNLSSNLWNFFLHSYFFINYKLEFIKYKYKFFFLYYREE